MTPSDRHATDFEVCILGAGPHGLAAAAHLVTTRPGLRDRLLVLDPAGRWMHGWNERLERLEILELRSPSVVVDQIGRPGSPDDIAQALVWLAVGDHRWVNGQHLVVDGGFTAGVWSRWVDRSTAPSTR